jgi:glycosyltransferase involved in cell wall biosynthesis
VRVAWIVYGSIDQPTGGYVYDRMLVIRGRAAGDEVHVVSIARGDAPEIVARHLDDLGADAIVGDALCSPELAPTFARIGPRAARVLLVHHLASWEAETPTLERAAARAHETLAVAHADHRIATSAVTARRLLAEHPGPAVDVVVPGADRLPLLPRADSSPGFTTLLFVGSLVPRKQLPLLLEALDRLRHPRLSLRIVGDASRDESHARAVDDRIGASVYLHAHVTRLGVIADDALAGELARCDALVLPSSLEGYGIAMTEALRAGLPLIAARSIAVPEAVRDGETALLFDDGACLMAALRRFADDASLRDRLRRAAVDCAGGLPSWQRCSSAFRGVLTRAVGAAPARRHARAP